MVSKTNRTLQQDFSQIIISLLLIASTMNISVAQNSINSSGLTFVSSDHLYSYSIGQIVYKTNTDTNVSLKAGVQRVLNTPPNLPNDTTIIRDTIITNTDVCFGAINSIIIAGNGSLVTLEDGSLVNFIAGQSIRFLPGFYAQKGSYMDAFITTDNLFCDREQVNAIVALEKSNTTEFEETSVISDLTTKEDFFKVYPNPNNGTFTVESIKLYDFTKVQVFTTLGRIIYSQNVENKNRLEVSIPYVTQGIYFIRITNSEKCLSAKIVIN